MRSGLVFGGGACVLLVLAGFVGCTLTVDLPEPGAGGQLGTTSAAGGSGGVGGGEEGCETSVDCPDPELDCEVPFCVEGDCGTVALARGSTPNNDVGDEPGDCIVATCDGNGHVDRHADGTDLPMPNDCADHECIDGELKTTLIDLGVSCSDGLCDGVGSCRQCLVASDCTMLAEDECKTRICNPAGHCAYAFTEVGTPVNVALQAVGDCNVRVCNGTGDTMDAPDDLDVPEDGIDCTFEECSAGSLTITNLDGTHTCGTQGVCDGMGHCVGCDGPEDCSGADDFCQQRTCVANECGVINTMVGTLLPMAAQTSGDCVILACDGNGAAHPNVDDGDVPGDDGVACTFDSCNLGVAVHPARPLNDACNQSGGSFCDGAGSCVECNAAGQCDAVVTECEQNVCMTHACQTAYIPSGTPIGEQKAGDCLLNVCDGSGDDFPQLQDADVPFDGNQCTDDVCSSGTPSNPNSPLGTACAQAGGNACDGAGNCVKCTNDGHCTPNQWCNAMVFTCSPDRANGASCQRSSQCQSGQCVDGVCCNTACNARCMACSSSKTGQATGTCSAVVSKTDPDNECGGVADVCYSGNCCLDAELAEAEGIDVEAAPAMPAPMCP
jgi:hypothetical protein